MKNISKFKIIIISLIIIYISRIVYINYIFNNKYLENSNYTKLSVIIIQKEKVYQDKISYLVRYNNDNFILNIYDILTDFKYGDILDINGKIIIPKKLNNLYEFDYKRYLNSRYIFGIITCTNYEKVGIKKDYLSHIYLFKDLINKKIDEGINNTDNSNLFKSMIYGYDINLNDDIKEDFNKIGLSHLLAVSGSNVSIILFLFLTLLEKFKINKYLNISLNILILLLFCIFSGLEISVIRASIMSIVILIFKKFNIKSNKFISLIISFFIILLYNPYIVFNISFILSFLAVLSIILFYKRIYSFFSLYIYKVIGYSNVIKFEHKNCIKSKLYFIYKLLKYFNVILSLTLSVQILIIPVQINIFNSFNFILFISNFLVFTISGVINITGYSLIICFNIPIINNILFVLSNFLLSLIINISNILSNINFTIIKLPSLNLFSFICYYSLIFSNFYLDTFYYKYRVKKVRFKAIKYLIIILTVSYLIYYNIYTIYFESFVYYFNVGQGNMALIKNGNSCVIVDIGSSNNNVSYSLMSFLKAKNISKINCIILTHFHSDHVNGLFELERYLSDLKIDSVMFSYPKIVNNKKEKESYKKTEYSYKEIDDFLNKNKIPQIMVSKDDLITIYSIKIKILSPYIDYIIKDNDILNANSIICIITFNNKNYLFLGDSTINTEKLIFKDFKFEIFEAIQIGHHGSKTSTSKYLIDNIKTKYAVISSCKKVFGHPNQNTLDILKKYNIKTIITEKEGGIML
jgi:competence protein ComEC